MGPARPGLVRNAVGSLAVLAIVAFIAFGLPLLDRSLPANRAVAGDTPFDVGAGVALLPPPDASLDLTRTRPNDERGTALFVVGAVRLSVVVLPFRGDVLEAAQRLRRKITNTAGYQVTGGERGLTTATGLAGRRGTYNSPGRLGEYGVLVHDGVVVEVTASGPEDQLRAFADSLDRSLRSITMGGSRP
jgi:hypothetical protein